MRVATDIGGTFTDLVYVDETTGAIERTKASSTPPNFEQGVLNVLSKAGIDGASGVSAFIHGSTVVINALTERNGASTALLTTRGFRDVLDIGRSNRPDIYNLMFRKPEAVVPRHLRFEVAERVDYRGNVLVPLDEDAVAEAAEEAWARGARALAVCFLHSYANPEHERRCAEIVAERLPEMQITASYTVTMEWREYERTSTAALNAYVQGTVADYLGRLEDGLDDRGVGRRRFIMQSSGGTMSFRQARVSPINMVESGPVGGVSGAAALAQLTGAGDVITMDIGGTTAKTSLVRAGQVPVTTEYRIGQTRTEPGYPIKVPVVDIVEIGAGGGSIAGIDAAGGLTVGPKSAGAVPGPACYPEGGKLPTVTDANLIVGRLNPDYFLGGTIAVSVERAAAAMATIAEPLGMSVTDTALGVIRLANANMVSAVKLISVRKGHDPRDFDLVACGGGGPMHAADLGRQLQSRRVTIPPGPGHFSAWGMLMTDMRRDWVKTQVLLAGEVTAATINATWAELEAEAAEAFAEDAADAEVTFVRAAEMRYQGQEHTVRVALPAGELDEAGLAAVLLDFHAEHDRQYTFALDVPVELVTFHLTGLVATTKPELARLAEATDDVSRAVKGERLVHFDADGEHLTKIYDRGLLLAGDTFEGPAVVEEPASSTVVHPGQRLTVDAWASMHITNDGERS
jgi:N-methylhydantoinase A